MASATDMSVDSAQETKLSPEEAMKAYLSDQLEFATAMGVFNTKFKWAYVDPIQLRAISDDIRADMLALVAALSSPAAPYDVVGFIAKLDIDDSDETELLRDLVCVPGFDLVACAKPNRPWMVFDLVKQASWQRGPVPHQLPSPPHTTLSGFAIIANKFNQFVVIEEDAFDPSTNAVNKRLGLVGGRKKPGQGAHFLGEPGGEIELETGLKGAKYISTLQQKVTVNDDMYGGDTIVNIDLYRVDTEDVPLVASGARQNAVPKWLSTREFHDFLAQKESLGLADTAVAQAMPAHIGVTLAHRYEHSVNSKGNPRWTMQL
jgi:hypothetical protein